MLRKRLIIILTFLDGVLFRTRNFIPDYRYTHHFIDTWSVDELVLLDISRDDSGRESFLKRIQEISGGCFVPVCAGGRIRTIDDISCFLRCGADKVVLNTKALEEPDFIKKAVEIFGSQCITVCVDVKKTDENYIVMKNFGMESTGISLQDWLKTVQTYGAGEILLQSVDLDGTLEGYDIKMLECALEGTSVPVLIASGAGNWMHFEKAFIAGADGVCTTNIYHFTESSIRSAKQYLKSKNIRIR